MGKAIVDGLVLVLIALIIAFVIVYFRRRKGKEAALDKGWAAKGDLNARQERALIAEVETAAVLFRQLLAPPPDDLSGDMTFLRYDDRRKVENWLHNYVASSANNTRRVIEHS